MIFVAFGFDVHDPYHQANAVVYEDKCPACGLVFMWHARSSWRAGFEIHRQLYHARRS